MFLNTTIQGWVIPLLANCIPLGKVKILLFSEVTVDIIVAESRAHLSKVKLDLVAFGKYQAEDSDLEHKPNIQKKQNNNQQEDDQEDQNTTSVKNLKSVNKVIISVFGRVLLRTESCSATI